MPSSAVRRLIAVAAASLATAAVGLTSAPAASAVPVCSARLNIPAKISLIAPYTAFPVKVSTDCPNPDYASWDIYGPTGLSEILIYDPLTEGATEYWNMYAHSIPAGAYTVRGGMGFTTDYEDIDTPDYATYVKYRCKAALSGTRSGSTVSLRASAIYYNVKLAKFVPRAYATARLQQLNADGTWTTIKIGTTTSAGVATFAVTNSTARTYRVWIDHTASVWEAASTGVRV